MRFIFFVFLDLELLRTFKFNLTINDVIKTLDSIPEITIKNNIPIEMNIQKLQNKFKSFYPTNNTKLIILASAGDMTSATTTLQNIRKIRLSLLKMSISGVESVKRVIINKSHDPEKSKFYIEGSNLLSVFSKVRGLDSLGISNHIVEVAASFGIEASRTTISEEIKYAMTNYKIKIDYRHLQLIADYMTVKGKTLGITRTGILKTKVSVLMLASFEKTAAHLFDAALNGTIEKFKGVSERILIGLPILLGTGMNNLYYPSTYSNHKLRI